MRYFPGSNKNKNITTTETTATTITTTQTITTSQLLHAAGVRGTTHIRNPSEGRDNPLGAVVGRSFSRGLTSFVQTP